jgi:hypothetical protein
LLLLKLDILKQRPQKISSNKRPSSLETGYEMNVRNSQYTNETNIDVQKWKKYTC